MIALVAGQYLCLFLAWRGGGEGSLILWPYLLAITLSIVSPLAGIGLAFHRYAHDRPFRLPLLLALAGALPLLTYMVLVQ